MGLQVTASRFESLEEVVCWLNAWGDEREQPLATREWRNGYDQAMRDAMDAVGPFAGDWLETWQRGKWKHRKRPLTASQSEGV